eukprot:scaffold106182_cov14-Prasinocladus_malaysianus.AAC.1
MPEVLMPKTALFVGVFETYDSIDCMKLHFSGGFHLMVAGKKNGNPSIHSLLRTKSRGTDEYSSPVVLYDISPTHIHIGAAEAFL